MSSTSGNNKSFLLSSTPKLEEEMAPKIMEKKGIVSILGSESQGTKPAAAAASFPRTFSADMSSKTWLAQNGFKSPMMKKTASSEQLSIISPLHSSNSSEEEEEQFEGKRFDRNKKQDDVWSSIVSQNKSQELPPPYVHPLVKKANSSLSEKSLEICTESLGSETGSDGFSSYPPSEAGSEANELDKEEEFQQNNFGLPAVAKYNYTSPAAASKKVQARTFPPPLPSLTRSSNEGSPLHMHSHRVNGRLVLEAVSVPSAKNFQAQRQGGRLRLTLLNTRPDQEKVEQANHDEGMVLDQKGIKVEQDFEEMHEIFENEEENDVETDEIEEDEMVEEVEKDFKGNGIWMEQGTPQMTSGPIIVHRSALMMKKLMVIENQNPKWSKKFNYTATAKSVEVDAVNVEKTQLPQSLPPRPMVARLITGAPAAAAAAASFNAEYFWRAKPVAASLKSQLIHHCSPFKNNTTSKEIASTNKPKAYEQQELVVLRNCKEARRSLLSWEPYCIATS